MHKFEDRVLYYCTWFANILLRTFGPFSWGLLDLEWGVFFGGGCQNYAELIKHRGMFLLLFSKKKKEKWVRLLLLFLKSSKEFTSEVIWASNFLGRKVWFLLFMNSISLIDKGLLVFFCISLHLFLKIVFFKAFFHVI